MNNTVYYEFMVLIINKYERLKFSLNSYFQRENIIKKSK